MKKITIGTAAGVIGFAGAIGGWIFTAKKLNEKINKKDARINKFKNYFDVTNEWVNLKNQGRNLEEYFVKNGWKQIAIYGMGELGNRLAEELKGSSVIIEYAIDKNADDIFAEMEVKRIDEELPPVDVIVVTPLFVYSEVEQTLREAVEYPIVSIEDVVFSM